jgi:sugar transferase (PEP-CTERM/EpsH1 system associated)
MHLLFVTCSLPYPPDGGAKVRDFHFLRHLARRHRVTCFCLVPEADGMSGAENLRRLGIDVHLFPQRTGPFARMTAVFRTLIAGHPIACADYFEPRLFAALRRVSADSASAGSTSVGSASVDSDNRHPIEAVQIEHSFLAPYLHAIPPALRSRALLDLHNVGATQYASLAGLPGPPLSRLIARIKAGLMSDWEARAAREFGAIAVVSQPDADWMIARVGTSASAAASAGASDGVPVHVVPNGVDTCEIQPRPQRAASRRLLFVGTMGYAPNADAACWFCEDVLPRLRQGFPTIAVDIVGRGPTPAVRALANTSGVRVTGGVDDLAPFYDEAAVVIVPLRAGGGTRLKILEAMAWGRAVVSTRAGCEGLDVIGGEHLLIADDPETFAACVATLLEDVSTRESIAARARAFVEAHHAWDDIAGRLMSHIEALAS